jgi:hypothetical protein
MLITPELALLRRRLPSVLLKVSLNAHSFGVLSDLRAH